MELPLQPVVLSLPSLVYVGLRKRRGDSWRDALGEEIFFRGPLGGWLAHRLGFRAGNVIQASAFLLPHLLVLTAGLDMWPFLVVPAAAGWLLGWLRHHSGSILPGWLVHSLANAFAALGAMA